MNTPCDNCSIRKDCDFLSFACRLTPREVVTVRRDLIKISRTEYLSRYDVGRTEKRMERVVNQIAVNPNGVFARRRARRAGLIF